MQRLSRQDIIKQLRRSGVEDTVLTHQALTAARLYFRSELPELQQSIEPLFIKQQTLMLRCTNSTIAQVIVSQQQKVLNYIFQVSGLHVTRIQFRI